jgi:hypothetical protein
VNRPGNLGGLGLDLCAGGSLWVLLLAALSAAGMTVVCGCGSSDAPSTTGSPPFSRTAAVSPEPPATAPGAHPPASEGQCHLHCVAQRTLDDREVAGRLNETALRHFGDAANQAQRAAVTRVLRDYFKALAARRYTQACKMLAMGVWGEIQARGGKCEIG